MTKEEKQGKLDTLRAAMAAVEGEATDEELAEAREFLAKQRASAGDKLSQAEATEAARAAAGVAAVSAPAPAAPGRRLSYHEEIQAAVAAGLASVAARQAKP